MEYRCPKCFGSICRLGNREKPFLCRACNAWYSKSEVTPPITNADRIRSMSDEELDKFLGDIQWDVANYCGGVTQKQDYPVPEQRGAWLDWLKQEVYDG